MPCVRDGTILYLPIPSSTRNQGREVPKDIVRSFRISLESEMLTDLIACFDDVALQRRLLFQSWISIIKQARVAGKMLISKYTLC